MFRLFALLLLTLFIPSLLLTSDTSRALISFDVSPSPSFGLVSLLFCSDDCSSCIFVVVNDAAATVSSVSSHVFVLFITRWLIRDIEPDLVMADDVMEWNVWLLVAEKRMQFAGRPESAAANWNKSVMDYNIALKIADSLKNFFFRHNHTHSHFPCSPGHFRKHSITENGNGFD